MRRQLSTQTVRFDLLVGKKKEKNERRVTREKSLRDEEEEEEENNGRFFLRLRRVNTMERGKTNMAIATRSLCFCSRPPKTHWSEKIRRTTSERAGRNGRRKTARVRWDLILLRSARLAAHDYQKPLHSLLLTMLNDYFEWPLPLFFADNERHSRV